MPRNQLIAIVVGLVGVLAIVGLYMAANRNGPPPRAGGGTAIAKSSPVVASAPAPEPTLAEILQDFGSPIWRTMANGCDTDITKDEIHIHGLSQYADWAHSNGIVSTVPIPDGDFTLSVDIKIAKYVGTTQFKNPYLRVEARNRSAIGVFANPDFFYRLHDWKNPQTMSSVHKLFGDEATNYHRMSLKWEEATETATATVDGEPIGTIHTQLGGQRKVSLFANTETKGVDIDVSFRGLKVEIPDGGV